MDDSRKALHLSSKLDESWARRKKTADEWNARLDAGEIRPRSSRRLWWRIRSRGNAQRLAAFEANWKQNARRIPSIVWALSDVFGLDFWFAGESSHQCACLWANPHTFLPSRILQTVR